MRRSNNILGEISRFAAERPVFGVCVLLFALFFAPTRVDAAEEWRRFLDALDERGYGDVALDYLKSLQESGTAPPELATELDYRLGIAALDSLATAPAATRGALVANARGSLEKFLETNPSSPSAAEANAALGRLLLDEGSRSLDAAARPGVSEAERARLLKKARLEFSDAKPRFDAAIEALRVRAKTQQESKDANPDELRRAQGALLDLAIRRETLRARTARTFPNDSPERKDGLTKARANLAQIDSTYRQYAGAFQARYFEAEIARELGDVDGALTALSELAVLPFEEQFYSLKTRALLLFAEIATERGDAPSAMNLVKKFNDWQDGDKLPKSYYSSAEGLRIRLLAARATMRLEELRRSDFAAFVDAGKKTFADSTDPTYQLMNVKGKTTGSNPIVVFALENLIFVAKDVGPDAAEAQELLKNPLFEGIDLSRYSFAKQASNFASAADAARRAGALYSRARLDAIGAAPDAVAEARRRVDENAQAAYSAFQKAFELADAQTPPDELDKLRLQFAALCFGRERFEEAFAQSDELVKNRPDFADAPTAATVALRSLQALFVRARAQGADDEEPTAARQKVAEYADFVLERWGSDESAAAAGAVQDASLVQMELAIDAGDVEAAQSLLAKIPETSPRRADAELRLGRSFWSAWNDLKSADADADSDENAAAERDAAAKRLLDGAEKALFDGLERKIQSPSGVSETDEATIYYVFLLAQVYEKQGNYENAEKWLTHPVIGPKTFVEKALDEETKAAPNAETPENAENPPNDADAENVAMASNANASTLDDSFQMAVLALTLTLLTADAERLDEAEQIVSRLERLVERAPENAEKLTGVYLRLGRRFEERLRELKDAAERGDESKKAALAAAAKGFETFLNRASAREAGNGYASLRWVADSFLSLGRGLSGTLADPPKEAVDYFAKAGRTYQTILKKIESDPNFAPNESAKLVVSLKIVECLRSAGAYTKALAQLKKLIQAAPNNLDVQLEAARTLQSRGRVDSKYYLDAIVGGAPDAKGRNVVWGWNGIIKRLGSALDKGDRYREAFYDAYLAKTLCRYLYARRLTDQEARTKQARDAENDLRRLYQTRPDLGGGPTFAKFDSAFKNFQKMRGEKKPIGLRADAKKNAVATQQNETKPNAPAPNADDKER